MQLELLQKYFYYSSYAKNSDLERFNFTKCVHVSTLVFSGSNVFYMFQGFQRLQICCIWMCGTKV